jgi:dTDP-4-dehydrorhamnose 3,5-epimerase
VHPLDPTLDIRWPAGGEPILSAKAKAPSVEEARRAGLLPVYGDCMAFERQSVPTLSWAGRGVSLM